jgi:Fe-S-cluster containining protein
VNHSLAGINWPKTKTEADFKNFENDLRAVLQTTYQKTDALLRTRFVKKKFCNCCGRCCKLLLIPIMPLEAINIQKKLEEDKVFYKCCAEYYLNQLRGGINNAHHCPYQLDDNTCGIYDIRPLICRAWLSTKENCMGEATTSKTLFDLAKIRNYYPEVLKDLYKFAAHLSTSVDHFKFLLSEETPIQAPLLQLLSREHKKNYRIGMETYEPTPSKGYFKYTKDFVELVKSLTGEKIANREKISA